MPKFLDKLGLSLRKARKSIWAVREMVLELSKMIDEEPPYWLREGYDGLPKDIVTNFFRVDVDIEKLLYVKLNKANSADAKSRAAEVRR